MSPPTRRNGGPAQGTAAVIVAAAKELDPPNDTAQQRKHQHACVTAYAYAPAGRRSQWLLLVKRCIFCGYAHAHRGTPAGGLRESGCGRGSYLLRTVVPARWAA